MREIKFRAWSESKKAMYKVLGYNDIEQCFFVQGKGRGKAPLTDIVLMQYTGMKDKNGVDIYEGDIIGIDVYHVNNSGETYKEIDYGEVLRDQSGLWDCDFKGYLSSMPLIEYVTEDEGIEYPWNITVEGNIYENPELMV